MTYNMETESNCPTGQTNIYPKKDIIIFIKFM